MIFLFFLLRRHMGLMPCCRGRVICNHLLITDHAAIEIGLQVGCRFGSPTFKFFITTVANPTSRSNAQNELLCEVRWASFFESSSFFLSTFPKCMTCLRASRLIRESDARYHNPLPCIPCPAPIFLEEFYSMHQSTLLMM